MTIHHSLVLSSILDNACAFAKFTNLKVNLPSHEEQKAAAKRAKAHRSVTEWMVGLADEPATVTRHNSWCSSCFARRDHQKVKLPTGQLPSYLCCSCGTPTLSTGSHRPRSPTGPCGVASPLPSGLSAITPPSPKAVGGLTSAVCNQISNLGLLRAVADDCNA